MKFFEECVLKDQQTDFPVVAVGSCVCGNLRTWEYIRVRACIVVQNLNLEKDLDLDASHSLQRHFDFHFRRIDNVDVGHVMILDRSFASSTHPVVAVFSIGW